MRVRVRVRACMLFAPDGYLCLCVGMCVNMIRIHRVHKLIVRVCSVCVCVVVHECMCV